MRRNNGISRGGCTVIGVIVVILLMQIFDAFCTDLQGKMQSFSLDDFLIAGRGMSESDAVAYMNLVNMPFFLISALAPLVRMLVDKIGKKPVFMANIVLLMTGCLLCFFSGSLTAYLLGCGIMTFCYTLDIQFIYLVEDIPYRYRATLKGIMNGLAAVMAMAIALTRYVCVSRTGIDWKYVYMAAAALGVIVFAAAVVFLREQGEYREEQNTERKCSEKKYAETAAEAQGHTVIQLLGDRQLIWMLVNMLILGTATAGITLYNEPYVKYAGYTEAQIQTVLFIQPIVTLFVHVAGGILADRFGRRRVILINMALAVFAVLIFIAVVHASHSLIATGVFWGFMTGTYFNAESLFKLAIMEYGSRDRIGSVSAFITIAYGLGDACAMLAFSFVVSAVGIGTAKLLLSVPLLIGAIVIFTFRGGKPICDDSSVNPRHDDVV